jgi:HEAT repeat protein
MSEMQKFIDDYYHLFGNRIVVLALVVVIITCIVGMFILLLWILINRNNLEKRLMMKEKLLMHYQTLLLDYLFSDDNTQEMHKIEKIARSEFSRNILINQMIDLSINLSGEVKGKLRELYIRMKLHQDSIRKVCHRKWHIKIKGFKELSFMDITDANDRIRKGLKSKNDILRLEAQLALVRLEKHDPFGFLDHLVHPFTMWEQLNVHELITFHNLPVPDFSRWLNSSNDTVVVFALNMIQVFKQTKAVYAVMKTLKHPNTLIRRHAIGVCGEIQLRETLPYLKYMYKDENYLNGLAIVQAMGKMPDKSMLGFLKLVLDKEEDVQLQIEAAMAINRMGDVGTAVLEKLMLSEYKNYQIIVRHVLDKRIN